MFKSIAAATASLALLAGSTSAGAARTAAAAHAVAVQPAGETVEGQGLYGGWNPLAYLLLAELIAAFLLIGVELGDDDDDGSVSVSP